MLIIFKKMYFNNSSVIKMLFKITSHYKIELKTLIFIFLIKLHIIIIFWSISNMAPFTTIYRVTFKILLDYITYYLYTLVHAKLIITMKIYVYIIRYIYIICYYNFKLYSESLLAIDTNILKLKKL